jgi:hypothetical protein
MSVMTVILEFVRREIGNKKGPENEGLVRSLHAVFRTRQVNPIPPLRLGRAFGLWRWNM